MEMGFHKKEEGMLLNRFLFYLSLHAVQCAVLLFARIPMNHYFGFRFLTWNLFLAWLPIFFAQLATIAAQKNSKILIYPLLSLWLLFLPNSFYIITDLIHLKQRVPVPLWYDVLLIFSFALNGCLAGMYSILQTQKLLQGLLKRSLNPVFILALFVLIGFGIYLGRFSRWNSWDLFSRPEALLGDIMLRLTHPLKHGKTWIFTGITGVMLWIFYQMLRSLQGKGAENTLPSTKEMRS